MATSHRFNWPQQPENDLRVDIAYLTRFTTEAINNRYSGILPKGVYKGFDASVVGDGSAFQLQVGSSDPSAALVEIHYPDKGAVTPQLKASMPADTYKTVTVTKGAKVYVVLEALYKLPLEGQENIPESEATSCEIKVVPSLSDTANYGRIVLAEVDVPASATKLLPEHILMTRKIDLGTEQVNVASALVDGDVGSMSLSQGEEVWTLDYKKVAYGTGNLMGRFTIVETVTGGAIEFLAVVNQQGKGQVTVTSRSDQCLIHSLQIVRMNGSERIELRAGLYYRNASSDDLYIEFKPFDDHNASKRGWTKDFGDKTAGEFTELAKIDFDSEGVGLGSTGPIMEESEYLSDRYLAINGKAPNAINSDSALLANKAVTSDKNKGLPVDHFDFNWIDPVAMLTDATSQLKQDLEAQGFGLVHGEKDPDLLTAPFAVVSHQSKMPTAGHAYGVKTFCYGDMSGDDFMRFQLAFSMDDAHLVKAGAFDTTRAKLHFRFLYGPSEVAPKAVTNWDELTSSTDLNAAVATLNEELGALISPLESGITVTVADSGGNYSSVFDALSAISRKYYSVASSSHFKVTIRLDSNVTENSRYFIPDGLNLGFIDINLNGKVWAFDITGLTATSSLARNGGFAVYVGRAAVAPFIHNGRVKITGTLDGNFHGAGWHLFYGERGSSQHLEWVSVTSEASYGSHTLAHSKGFFEGRDLETFTSNLDILDAQDAVCYLYQCGSTTTYNSWTFDRCTVYLSRCASADGSWSFRNSRVRAYQLNSGSGYATFDGTHADLDHAETTNLRFYLRDGGMVSISGGAECLSSQAPHVITKNGIWFQN